MPERDGTVSGRLQYAPTRVWRSFFLRSLELLIPGLLGPVNDPDAVGALLPELPALAHVLARSDPEPAEAAEMEVELLRGFGMGGGPWPIAAVARAGEADGEEPGARWWLRVDPVHLRIDMTHARLFGSYALAPTMSEAQALVETLNGHFRDEDLVIETPAPDRWYMAFDEARDLSTHSPAEVAGRNVDHFLPRGADGPRWRSLLNEVQMLLHEHPVNEARAAEGHLPINSIWPWGGGFAPTPTAGPDRVLSNEPVGRGLAALAGRAAAALPASLVDWEPAAGRTLLVEDAIRDPLVHGEAEAWLQALQAVEERWFAPLIDRLRDGALDQLTIITGGACRFTLARRALRRRFWRRGRPWTYWLEAEA